MLHLIIMYSVSIIITKIIRLLLNIVIIKEGADRGLKVDFSEIDDIKYNNMVDIQSLLISYEDLIPLYNLISALIDSYDYGQNKDIIFYDFQRNNIASKMNKLEINEYKKDPGFINALIIEDKVNNLLDEYYILKINDSIVYYNFDNNDSAKVFYSEGDFSYLSKEKQEKILNRLIKYSFLKAGEMTYNNIEEFANNIKRDPYKTVKEIIVNATNEKSYDLYNTKRDKEYIEMMEKFIEKMDKESLMKLKEIILIPLNYDEEAKLIKKNRKID